MPSNLTTHPAVARGPDDGAGGLGGGPGGLGGGPRRRRDGWSRGALLGAACGVAGLLVLQVTVLRQPGFLVSRPALLYLTLLWWVLGFGTAALLVVAAPRRLAVGLLLAAAVAMPAVALTHGPRLSDDLYRYAWDGRVQAAGIDPYRYGPLAPQLTSLRDPWLFPNSAGCTEAHPVRHCTRLNYPHAHTIYPPVAEAYFTAVHVLPGPPRDHKLQLYASLLSVGLIGLLAKALAARGRDPRHVAFYALSPLAGIDTASDAHVDVLGALLVVAGLVVLATPGGIAGVATRRRAALAGGLLGAAVAVKLYPALVLVAAARRRPVTVLTSAAAVVGISYVPHVLAVGTGVLGFLPQYLRVEGYDQGSRFLLLAGLGLHGSAAKAVAAGVLAAVAVAVLRSDPRQVPAERAALWLVGAAFLVATPAQPWYGCLLGALAVLAGRPEWLAVPAASYVLYLSLFTDVPGDAWTLRVLAYALAALTVALVALVRLGRRRRLPAPGRGTNRSGAGATAPSESCGRPPAPT